MHLLKYFLIVVCIWEVILATPAMKNYLQTDNADTILFLSESEAEENNEDENRFNDEKEISKLGFSTIEIIQIVSEKSNQLLFDKNDIWLSQFNGNSPFTPPDGIV